MNTAKLAIKRPIFITCIVALIIIIGGISYRNIGVELMPDITFPIIAVTTTYAGAAPEEMEKLVSKPLEDELGAISGIKHISSQNDEGVSTIIIEFNMDIDIDKVAQDVRDKVNLAMDNLPDDLTTNPVVHKFDPDSFPVLRLILLSDLPSAELYDLANERVKPQIVRVNDVGNVQIIGGNRREIQVELDQNKLNEFRIPMTRVVSQMKNSGSNVPIGKKEHGAQETVFRAMGEFSSLDQIRNALLSFSGDVGHSISVKTLGTVSDGTEDVLNIGRIYSGEKKLNAKGEVIGETKKTVQSCVFLSVIKQSGSNTVKVCDDVKKQLDSINGSLKTMKGNSRIIVALDQSKWIRTNVSETVNTIIIGIILAILVVFLFLGNVRSTIITAIAIPNSLLGAVIVMKAMSFTFNVMTLMALSLVVGLLVDDAIVVRENIFRKLEKGMNPHKAAEIGTTEVMLAVIATTLTIIAVFFPIGMLEGVMGKFFKPFGFTIVFAMAVSLFDALTVAPFLSAYFAGDGRKENNIVIRSFERFQDKAEQVYIRVMHFCLKRPLVVILSMLLIFASSIMLLGFVKKTFIPTGDRGEFSINITMPSGSSLQGTSDAMKQIEDRLQKLEDLDYYTVTIGGTNGEPEKASIDCFLNAKRKRDTDANKNIVRSFLSDFAYAKPSVSDPGGSGDSPFILIVSGYDLPSAESAAEKILEQVRTVPGLVDIDSSIKKGKPELRVNFDTKKMQDMGVSDTVAGMELRYNIAGSVVGKLRQNGLEYDIRARLKPEQRDLRNTFSQTRVPNTSGLMVPLSSVSSGESTTGSAQINRRDKAYIVKITANLAADGAIGNAMQRVSALIKQNVPLPLGVTYSFSGQSENFAETASSIIFALVLAIIFIYLVLSSLYESFVTPFTILLAIPPALTGALFALFITNQMLNMFSMIGMVLLLGLVTKNSILLVDHAMHGVRNGLDRKEAVLQAGIRRLRPILMTTFAMLAGMLPLALGIGEAAKMRQSMGIAIIGGLIVSTVITLVVVPAVFEYIDRFRHATESRILVRPEDLLADEKREKNEGKKASKTKRGN
jgi:hydrophobic/amphiphilic exporter-1 (mainly G- bacteria), HAE1 family